MVSVAEPTCLLEFSGTIRGSGVWNTGLWTTMDTFPADPTTGAATVADGGAHAFRAMWLAGLSAMNTADTTFTGCTCRVYAAGASAASAVATAPPAAATQGSGTDSAAASQACVVTLLSPQAGKSGRGRMYMPATAALGSATEAHAFTATELGNLMTGLTQFFIAVEALTLDASHALFPVVRSPKMNTVHPFKMFRVDARPDRQEHRERGIVFPSLSGSFA